MGHGGNVIDELMTDHREVEELFGRIDGLAPGDKDRKLYADQVTMELVRHSVAEEAYLYPAVRKHVPGGDALADQEIGDHARAERLMKDLEGCDAGDPEFDRLMTMLMTEIRSHLADEEQNLFPRLRASCPPKPSTPWATRSARPRRSPPPARTPPPRAHPRPTNCWHRASGWSTGCATP